MSKFLILIGIILSYALGFSISSIIVEHWVLFWEYGWTWNWVTVPPFIMWSIFFDNILPIAIIGLGIAVIVFIIGLYGLTQ